MGYFCVKVKSRKSLCVLLVLILCLIISSEFTSAFSDFAYKGDSFAQRINFLNELGIFPEAESETVKRSSIPETFSDVYARYNQLQIDAGFDLSNYCGRNVDVYEYTWKRDGYRDEFFVHIIVCNKEIIGGDICDNRLNGEMLPLKEVL